MDVAIELISTEPARNAESKFAKSVTARPYP